VPTKSEIASVLARFDGGAKTVGSRDLVRPGLSHTLNRVSTEQTEGEIDDRGEEIFVELPHRTLRSNRSCDSRRNKECSAAITNEVRNPTTRYTTDKPTFKIASNTSEDHFADFRLHVFD